jgi:hypothetical protein
MTTKYGKHDLRFCNILSTIYMPKGPLKFYDWHNLLIIIRKKLKSSLLFGLSIRKILDCAIIKVHKKYPVVGFIQHNSGKIYPQVCKLKAKGKKRNFF